jgi:hypothetical protein
MDFWLRIGAIVLITVLGIAFLMRPKFFRHRKPNDYQHSDYAGGAPGGPSSAGD